ncbi:MAG: hypothetical protein ACP5J4_04410 [Anaerolineae bacterium]
MLGEHQDILWLAGQVLLSRNFVAEVEAHSFDRLFALCPYGDLTEQEKAVFRSAFKDERLRHVVEQWWTVYDEERQAGVVPQVTEYWEM